jgi:hypothetical protein
LLGWAPSDANRSTMPRGHRTTSRSILTVLLLGLFAGTAHAEPPKQIIFPVVGPVQFENDFGAPRGSRSHRGNDVMAARKAPVVAVEAGRVHRPSWSSSDCALILEGASGTEYWYLHLNDVPKSGGRGGCVPGVAYAPNFKSGMRVRAGQLVGYVGDSGNARGTGTHLHFEVRPGGNGAVSPYALLKKAPRLLYAVPGDVERVRLALFGSVVPTVEPEAFRMKVATIAVANGWRGKAVRRTVKLGLAPNVVVERKNARGLVAPGAMTTAVAGEQVTVWTPWFTPTLATQVAAPNALAAERIRLRGTPPAKKRRP